MTRALRLLTLPLLFTVAACSGASEKPAEHPPRPVLTQTIALSAERSIGPFVGTIQPRYQTVRSFQLPGRILSREAAVGDRVTKDQELARLDSTTQEFQLASAQADVANAQAQFGNLAAAEERIRALAEGGNSPQAQLDAATSARETAAAQLAQARANLKRAEDQVGYTRIIAEFDGVVVSVDAEIGQVVSAGQPVLTISRPEERDAVFDIPEALANTLAVGDSVKVETSEPLRQASEATVREIAPTAGGVARTRRVRLTLTDPPETFLLGATVDIAWQVPLATPAAIVPSTAILAKDGKSFVWLVDKAASTVAAREVETNSAGTTSTSITSGINDGDTIVVVGVNSLTEGQTVSLGAGEGK